jgi:hypothetical protein
MRDTSICAIMQETRYDHKNTPVESQFKHELTHNFFPRVTGRSATIQIEGKKFVTGTNKCIGLDAQGLPK